MVQSLNEKVGERVKAARRAAGVRQGALAEVLGMAPSGLCALERGTRRWTIEKVVEVADALGVSPMELLPLRGN